MEQISRAFYGKVKSIVGNEIEIEIGTVPEETWNEEIPPEEKKKNPMFLWCKLRKGKTHQVWRILLHLIPPEYGGSIFGENGEINLTYTGESRTLIIPAGTDIRNRLGKKKKPWIPLKRVQY